MKPAFLDIDESSNGMVQGLNLSSTTMILFDEVSICVILDIFIRALEPASVAQLDAPSDWRPGGRGFNPRRGRQHSFVEIDHEIFSTVILSLPLIQEGQLTVSEEECAQYWLTA